MKYGIPAVLLLAFAALAWTSMLDKSPVFDEPTHLASGYNYWRFNDYRLNPENGNSPSAGRRFRCSLAGAVSRAGIRGPGGGPSRTP